MTAFWCEHAWLQDGPRAGIRVVEEDGLISAVSPAAAPGPGDVRLSGLVLPGFADAHSHAFHRALRGRTAGRGSFWSWREAMYRVAERLDPDSYLALARAVYAELALAGVVCVGEFHYLHHGPRGARYADPNAMSEALIQAANEAGVRLTVLDTCYVAGGLQLGGHSRLDPVQQRFSDGDATAWAARFEQLPRRDGVRVGAAIHSIRAVPAAQLRDVAEAAGARPLHVHLSEQPAENEACRAVYGCSPTELLAEHDVLGPRTTAVHAVHVSDDDVALLGGSHTAVCACPTTEADLADGIGPFRQLEHAGSPLCLGSDQHVAADLLGEARALEQHERLRTGERGRFSPQELVDALSVSGHAALGWPDAGRIQRGARADLVAIALDTPRTAGIAPAQAPVVAGTPDISTVVVGGRTVVDEGRHVLGDVGTLLRQAIEPLWVGA